MVSGLTKRANPAGSLQRRGGGLPERAAYQYLLLVEDYEAQFQAKTVLHPAKRC